MGEIEIYENERGQTVHRGPAHVRQSRQATARQAGTLLLLCPHGHLIDSCETGTVTASAWLADASFGTPRIVECGGKIPEEGA